VTFVKRVPCRVLTICVDTLPDKIISIPAPSRRRVISATASTLTSSFVIAAWPLLLLFTALLVLPCSSRRFRVRIVNICSVIIASWLLLGLSILVIRLVRLLSVLIASIVPTTSIALQRSFCVLALFLLWRSHCSFLWLVVRDQVVTLIVDFAALPFYEHLNIFKHVVAVKFVILRQLRRWFLLRSFRLFGVLVRCHSTLFNIIVILHFVREL